jgi:uncharacterized protein YjbJ (UPF0337 family)
VCLPWRIRERTSAIDVHSLLATPGGRKTQEFTMNWDQIDGKWKQMKGSLQAKWGEISDDEVDQIDGDRQRLVGKLQERYGLAREEAERQVDDWSKAA